MVFDNQIEQHGSFLFYRWVQFLSVKSLIDLPNGTLKGTIFLVAEKGTLPKAFLELGYGLHGVLIGGVELRFCSDGIHSEFLVVVEVEHLQGVGVIRHYLEQRVIVAARERTVRFDGTPQELYHLVQLAVFLLRKFVFNGEPLDEVLFQHAVGPDAEQRAVAAFHAVTD